MGNSLRRLMTGYSSFSYLKTSPIVYFIINFMRTILISIITIFISHQLIADEAPACPDRRYDPDKFCPVGMVWSEEAQQCLEVV